MIAVAEFELGYILYLLPLYIHINPRAQREEQQSSTQWSETQQLHATRSFMQNGLHYITPETSNE